MVSLLRHLPCKRLPLYRGIATLTDKLTLLRDAMVANSISALVVPSGDPHMSEYIADCYDYKNFISGFSGSAGTLLITKTGAYLWTDSR